MSSEAAVSIRKIKAHAKACAQKKWSLSDDYYFYIDISDMSCLSCTSDTRLDTFRFVIRYHCVST